METAKLFKNGRSQAVRLPKDFRFEGDEVFIKKTAQGVLLLPKDACVWEQWSEKLDRLTLDDDALPDRNRELQQREGLDDLFD